MFYYLFKYSWNCAFVFLLLLLTVLPFSPANAVPGTAVNAFHAEGIQSLKVVTGNAAEVSLNKENGTVRFFRMTGKTALALFKTGTPEIQASAFFSQYGSIFGISDAESQLSLVQKKTNTSGRSVLKYQQVYKGMEVFAGELKVIFDKNDHIKAVSGNYIPEISLDTKPGISQTTVKNIALSLVKSQQAPNSDAVDLIAENIRLLVLRSGWLKGVSGSDHLVYEVEVINSAMTIREFVYVDAQSGKIIQQITGIHDALDRKISESRFSNVIWEDSASDPDPIPAGWANGSTQNVTDWQNEIDGALETYNLFASAFGFISFNGADATMLTVNNDAGISCPNAYWNGISTNFCSDVTGDDTVAHEWGHAYTEFTNNLIYQWQSGALNESYSDIWGEVVDLINARGTDLPDGARSENGCSIYGNGANNDNSYRWLSGEDDPAFGGAIRDMWTPTCYGDPGKVSDNQYHCNISDSGGVHTNSGVPNHAFALLVDGGSYNARTITGIGLTKASHIVWEAQNFLTVASNFADWADALETACSVLIGNTLNNLDTTTPVSSDSGEVITSSDCSEVSDVIAAVELRLTPSQCNFETLLMPDAPELCPAETNIATVNFQDWESGLGGWSVGTRAVANPNSFDTPDWLVVNGLPSGAPSGSTQAALVENLIIGNCQDDDETGVLYLQSPLISIPDTVTDLKLAFDHWVATEADWDGGNVKISINGGAFTLIPGNNFIFNPYNRTLKSSGNSNPLKNQQAFSGSDEGAVNGSWGQSQIDLNGIASAGDNIIIRYEFGIDGCYGLIGWYIDDVHLYSCSASTGGGAAMHVENIDITNILVRSRNRGIADVTVYDETGFSVAGANVTGEFTGCSSSEKTAITDSTGTAVLNSTRTSNTSCEWQFCVTNVTHSNFVYDSGANVVTCMTTGLPLLTGIVAGTVTDDSSGNPIISASVVADSGQNSSTDSAGEYMLTDVAPGSINITASAAGYLSSAQAVIVVENATTTLNFPLTAVTGNKGTGTIKVKVKDSAGQSLTNATVSSDSGQICTTSGLGRCSLSGVPEGVRRISVELSGYSFEPQDVTLAARQLLVLEFNSN